MSVYLAMKRVVPLVVILVISVTSVLSVPCTEDATYEVSLSCYWNAQTHPKDYPSTAHWSRLCGTAHSAKYSIWRIGNVSTDGVKDIAETGSCAKFEEEVRDCDEAQTCSLEDYFAWPCTVQGPTRGICDFSGTVKVSYVYPMVSMMTMVAPTPDWFVGVDSVNLCVLDEESGEKAWIERYPPTGSIGLNASDAGTDSGSTFLSANYPTIPRAPITEFDGLTAENIFYNEVAQKLNPLCTISITLQE